MPTAQTSRKAGTLAVRRSFDVAVPLDTAWAGLAEVERYPEWAPHIAKIVVSPPGPLGPSSTGTLSIRKVGRSRFKMSAWDKPNRWEWTGGFPGMRIVYDHQFTPAPGSTTTMTWTVSLHGPLGTLIRPLFARIYGRNVDRAIPLLQHWIATQPDRS